jgi:UDP-N-acetylmuramate--alanine ligase
LGVKNGHSVFADYAHHPKEIDATLKAFSEPMQKEFSVVFQPHTYSRTRDLFSDFYKVLSKVKHLAICKIFAARETPISAEEEWSLAEKLNAVKLNEKEDLLSYIEKETQEGRSVVILGAGDVYDMAKEITFF